MEVEVTNEDGDLIAELVFPTGEDLGTGFIKDYYSNNGNDVALECLQDM